MTDETINKFITDQLSVWPLASANFRSVKSARERTIRLRGIDATVQHNPCRIQSSTAETDPRTLSSRPCFLCLEHRQKEQTHLDFEGRKGRKYRIQVNPFPIFPRHLVIPRTVHTPQSIWKCYVDMLDLCKSLKGFTIFYNGPEAGASAPDHMHFQACPSGQMPLEIAIESEMTSDGRHLQYLTNVQDASLYIYRQYCHGIFVLRARTAKSMAKLFYRLLDCVPIPPGETEPGFNLFCWHSSGEYRAMVILRTALRSHHYHATGEDHLTISPGCADMCGLFIAPMEEDFHKVTATMLEQMLDEVTISPATEEKITRRLTRTQSTLEVGILSSSEIEFEIISDGAGPQKVSCKDGRISYNGVLYDELLFDAVTPSSLFAEPSFILRNVVIGKEFHWERKQDQRFAGSLKFIVDDSKVTAVNIVGIEDYLLSVISSEMKPTASLEFLKAHAVISRSWVLSRIRRRLRASGMDNDYSFAESLHPSRDTASGVPGELIRWWDHEDHHSFDVCADDHCQRYQGLTGAIGTTAREAVDETWGEVLTCEGELCDTRFSKCCGGVTERYSSAWDSRDYPYLRPVRDGDPPYCNTSDARTLSQVLNDYDLETKDFYNWTVSYTIEELSDLLRQRTGVDFGRIISLEPVETGPSGRIIRLRIKGALREMTIGKELMIRRALSPSHLKSSAFTISRDDRTITLHGRGWGHGVGLCQIGAAVMANRGYDYKSILTHYYPGTELTIQ